MALKTLRGVEKIDGFKVLNIDKLAEMHPDKWDPQKRKFDWDWFKETVYPAGNYIIVDEHKNSITFKIQDAPVKEAGVNGCQVDTLVDAAAKIVEGLNAFFPCQENGECISHLYDALAALRKRKANREARGVEGENKE